MWKRGIMKTKRANNAVSEIIGVILLLAMAVALFSTVYLFVMHDALDISENSPPSVTVLGTIGGSDIILEHRGGDALSLDTEIMITISGIVYNMTVGDLMDNESKEDGKWSVGEKLSYSPSMNITGRQVGILVIDAKSDSVVMQGMLQEGETSVDPFAITRYATDVISYSAKLWMDYDFKNYSGYLGFAWKPDGGNWTYSSPSLGSGSLYSSTGSYTEVISDLIPGTLYWFKAQLKYGSTTFEGSMVSFITFGWEMALWHFNESTGTIAFDSSGYSNDGILKPSALNRPQWSNTTSDPKWTTWVNGSALTFDGIDDYVEVPDDDTLDLTNAIAIEAWVKPLEHSEGIIGDIQSVIDTSEFGSLDVYELDLIHVSGDVYAIACRGTDDDGLLITLRIDSSGMIIDSIIDSLEFDTSDGWQPNIIHVSGNIFAIAYTGSGSDGFLVTVEIANDGAVTDSVIDSFEFDESNGVGPSIIHVNNSLYAVVYTGSTTGGHLITLEMANNGTITKSINDTFIFDEISDGYADEFNMIQVGGETYAIVYNAPDEDGRIRTVKIENNGNIAGISVVKFDSSRGIDPDITHVNGCFYAIVYRGFNSTGNLRTVEIADDGTILSAFQGDGTYTDHFKFSARGGEPSIICVNGTNYYAIAYRGPPGASDDRGYVSTVEIWSNGTINHAIIDTLQLDASRCYGPNIISINGTNYYAVTYTGYRDDGFVKTVEIANNGTINQTITDAQEFGIFDCYEPDVIHISGDIYAIASRGLDSDGYVRTVKIVNNGSITDMVIDTLEFDTDYGGEFSIIHINGNIYAIAYRGPGDDGFVKTVEIASNGTITNSVIDSLEFDTSYGREPTIIHINGNIYAIAYRGPGSGGWVKTVEIANNGAIKNSFVDSLEFDTSQGYYPDIIHVNGSYYAIAYMGPSSDGYLRTVKIANNGTITGDYHNSWPNYGYYIDTLEFDTSYGYRPNIIHVGGRVYAIAYTGSSYDGYLKTLRIGDNGNITDGIDDWWEYHTSNAYDSRIIHINGDVYAIVYREYYGDAYVKTVEISLNETVGRILSKDGSYGISANSTRVFATINAHSQIISAPISPGFNHIIFTYNKDNSSEQLKLYINGTKMANGTLTEAINTNSNKLYIGGVNAIIDEIVIYGMDLSQADVTNRYVTMTS